MTNRERARDFLLTLPMGHKIGHGKIELTYNGSIYNNELDCFCSHLEKLLNDKDNALSAPAAVPEGCVVWKGKSWDVVSEKPHDSPWEDYRVVLLRPVGLSPTPEPAP